MDLVVTYYASIALEAKNSNLWDHSQKIIDKLDGKEKVSAKEAIEKADQITGNSIRVANTVKSIEESANYIVQIYNGKSDIL